MNYNQTYPVSENLPACAGLKDQVVELGPWWLVDTDLTTVSSGSQYQIWLSSVPKEQGWFWL